MRPPCGECSEKSLQLFSQWEIEFPPLASNLFLRLLNSKQFTVAVDCPGMSSISVWLMMNGGIEKSPLTKFTAPDGFASLRKRMWIERPTGRNHIVRAPRETFAKHGDE